MKTRKQGTKLLCLILSVMMLFACMPFAVSAEESTEFVSENLLMTKLESATGILVDIASGIVSENNRFDSKGALAASTDGDTTVATDVYGALDWNPAKYVGAQYTLTETVFVSKTVIYAGYDAYQETYDVYASDNIDSLYSTSNKVGDGIVCGDASKTVEINKEVKYIAFVCTNYSGNMRVKEFELWSGDGVGVFVSENLLSTKLESSTGILVDIASGIVSENNRFDSNGALAGTVDGVTTAHTDVYGALDWNPAKYVGAQYTLAETVYVEKTIIYSGYDTAQETYDVYASDNLGNLYTADNKVGCDIVCGDAGVSVEINKQVKYIAYVCTNYSGNMRVKEFELWSGDPSGVFASENVLSKETTEAYAIVQWPASGQVDRSAAISDTNLAKFTDGDVVNHIDINGTLEWDPPRYIGAEYVLDNDYFIGNIKLYASIGANYPEVYSIYASETYEDLYSAFNRVATSVSTTGQVIAAEINATVRYVAFICEGYTGNPRIKEIEAWTADPTAVPEPEDDHVKVLTIGNSFAENASVYASEIAYANGQELTFGYLKFPSCTLEKHLEAATNNLAVFKFQLTDPTGKKTVVKSGEGVSFTPENETTNANGATIAEALEYTDWDIIVFQQESSNARDYTTYSYLGDLMEYVRGYCPDAEFMFHEVWRWGTWEADQFALIKANSEAAAREYDLTLIPSGLAFEYAREALEDVTAVNEDDGNYQHANTYGMYIAGCAYVSAIFGIEISADTFTSHPYVNDNGNVALLTAAANKAVDYYNSYGDLNDDGEVTIDDVTALRKALLGVQSVDTTLADTNNDGHVDIRDLVHVKRHLSDETVVLG